MLAGDFKWPDSGRFPSWERPQHNWAIGGRQAHPRASILPTVLLISKRPQPLPAHSRGQLLAGSPNTRSSAFRLPSGPFMRPLRRQPCSPMSPVFPTTTTMHCSPVLITCHSAWLRLAPQWSDAVSVSTCIFRDEPGSFPSPGLSSNYSL